MNYLGGTWEQIESGLMLRSTATSSGQTGGSSTASFTPNRTVGDTTLSVDQMPIHRHDVNVVNPSGGGGNYVSGTPGLISGPWGVSSGPAGGSQPHTHSFTGTSQTINTVSPYITVYMYKRVS